MSMQNQDFATDRIQAGWSAYGRDGDKIGDIEEVGPDYVLVTKGLIFPSDLFIPASAVAEIDPDEGRIYLTVEKSAVDDQNWVAPPLSGYESATRAHAGESIEGLDDTAREPGFETRDETDFDATREGRRAEDVGAILTGAGTATTGTGHGLDDDAPTASSSEFPDETGDPTVERQDRDRDRF